MAGEVLVACMAAFTAAEVAFMATLGGPIGGLHAPAFTGASGTQVFMGGGISSTFLEALATRASTGVLGTTADIGTLGAPISIPAGFIPSTLLTTTGFRVIRSSLTGLATTGTSTIGDEPGSVPAYLSGFPTVRAATASGCVPAGASCRLVLRKPGALLLVPSHWTAVVIIVAIGALSAMYRAQLTANAAKAEEAFKQLSQRLARVEERLANVESLVLDKEREEKFTALKS